MVELNPTVLNTLYATHRQWYPAIQNSPEQAVRISGIADILDDVDLVMLDSFGVLCRGADPIPGASEAIDQIRKAGKACCVVSNDTMTNRSNAVAKYQKRGFDFSVDEVVTSLEITEGFLTGINNPSDWAVIAPLIHPSNSLMTGMVRLNQTEGHIPESVSKLLFLTGAGWTEEMQNNLVQSAHGKQFELSIGNPDIGAPYGDRIAATPGYFLSDLVTRTNQTSAPRLYGKPDCSIFTYVAERFDAKDPSRILMVGDTLYTDILGGNAMGFKTLLLECGIYRGRDINKEIDHAGITPDYIAPCL